MRKDKMAGITKYKKLIFKDKTLGVVHDFSIEYNKELDKNVKVLTVNFIGKDFDDDIIVECHDYGSDMQFGDDFKIGDMVRLLLLDDYCVTIKKVEKVEVDLCFDFSKMDDEQIEHLSNANSELRKAGVKFDTGMDLVNNIREWHLDFSLKGVNIKISNLK